MAYQQDLGLKTGDELVICTDAGDRGFTVAGFVRDAQMASSLSSATRFLVAEDDLASLRSAGGGDPEIIVEYRLTDVSLSDGFQTAYESQEALPKNGAPSSSSTVRSDHAGPNIS